MSCGGGAGDPPGGPGDGGPRGTSFSISGEFTTGTGTVPFTIKDAETGGSRAAVSAESYAISGQLVDGDIVFNLSGTYDPVARDYSVSASSSFIRYSINGAFDASGKSLGSTATLAVKDGDEFKSYTYVVTVTNSTVNVDGKTAFEDSEEYQDLSEAEKDALNNGGVPEWGRGWWTFTDSWPNGSGGTVRVKGKALATQWSWAQEGIVTLPDGNQQVEKYNYNIIEMNGSGSEYEVIVSYPRYNGSAAQVEDAFKDFLTKNGLTAKKTTPVDFETGEGWPEQAGIYYFIYSTGDDGFDVQVIYCDMPSFDWSKFDVWYSTNYLESYLVKQNVTPTTYYDKYKLVFNGDKSTMTAITLMDASEKTTWSSISGARAATTPRPDSTNVFKR